MRVAVVNDSDNLKGVKSNQALLDAGWERRFLAAPDRVKEAVELYTEMGLEVRTETLAPKDFESGCSSCASAVCKAYVLIYTRSKKEGAN